MNAMRIMRLAVPLRSWLLAPTTRRGGSGIRVLVAGLVLAGWLHTSQTAGAGGVIIHLCLERADAGLPCLDTDGNECTEARCDDQANCDQNAIMLNGASCTDVDGNPCTVSLCVSGECVETGSVLSGPIPACVNMDTDGNVCTIPSCRNAQCDQEGSERDCNDDNACTLEVGCHPVHGCQRVPILCFDTDGNECTYPVCEPSSGDCNNVFRTGETCEDTDGNACTTALCVDTCTGGDCGAFVSCDQLAECDDATPPEVTCPPSAVEVFCLESTAIGDAPTFVDDCDPDLAIDFSDAVTPIVDPDDPVDVIIEQSWQATNDCGLVSECEQTITLFKPKFYLDIKPGSCPNPIDTRSRGFLRMSLLGTPEFDVTKVDVSSLMLSREDEIGGTIAPLSTVLQDTGTPFEGARCGCHRLNGDGALDLTLRFNNLAVVTALQLNTVPPGETIRLIVSGSLSDGCGFNAADCMVRSTR